MDKKKTIHKPFIHEHPLLYSARFAISSTCSGCEAVDNIYGGYFCNTPGCFHCFHKECAEAPLEINHPSHPEHPILLTFDKEDSSQCYLCGLSLPVQRYSCSTCEFRVDIACGMKPWPHAIEHPLCHDHPLIFKGYKKSSSCEVCKESTRGRFYSCIECDLYFHVECIHFSKEVKHPCHSKHPLKLIAFNALTVSNDAEETCILCEEQPENVCYHCSICDFTTCLRCTRSPPPLVYEDIKTHRHQLTRIFKRISYVCDACGPEGEDEDEDDDTSSLYHGSYICHQCDFIIHGKCIGLPRVISINRHDHRISFTYHIGAGFSECGVCFGGISQYHGAYYCSVCPTYAVHSECATDMTSVWDGVELEGIPDVTEDIAPYKVVGDDLIIHVSHVKHPLRLYNKGNIIYDHEWIRCEACMDPVGVDSIYVCEECCFVLHEKCASFPTKQKIFFDYIPQMLDVNNTRVTSYCRQCSTLSDGFKYSAQGRLKVDVRCCSLSEPFVHAGHLHPLYLHNTIPGKSRCKACMIIRELSVLGCEDCNFDLCFFCATLPLKTRHRNDEHPLTLCCGKKASGQNWCDICEGNLDPSLWFYTCSDCEVTLHARCVIGDFSRINARSTIEFYSERTIFEAVPNQNSRPLCSQCSSRCKLSIVIKEKNKDHGYFCSLLCLKNCLRF